MLRAVEAPGLTKWLSPVAESPFQASVIARNKVRREQIKSVEDFLHYEINPREPFQEITVQDTRN